MSTSVEQEGISHFSNSKEMELDVVWTVERKPGKHVKLYRKNKEQQFSQRIDKTGRYSLALHTPDFLPGGQAGRKVECLVSVFKNKDQAPEVEIGSEKHIKDYTISTNDAKLLILRDIYEVHSDQNTTLVEFEIKENELPACVHIVAKTLTPFIGMRFSAKLLRNADLQRLSENLPETFGPESEFMFKTLTIDAIRNELSRDSEQKRTAYEKGMIRPFMYLVSMHPIMRVQIADLLGIKLFDLEGNEDWSHDAHAQALLILDKHLKGLGSISDHSWETSNPANKKSNWYQCLYRGAHEIHTPDDESKMAQGKKTTRLSMKNCQDPNDDAINEMELDFLLGARDIHVKEMKKMQGDTNILFDRVDRLVEDPEVKQIFALMRKHGIVDDDICRFLIEISVCADFNNWQHYHKLDKKSSDDKKKKESTEEKLQQWQRDKESGCHVAPIKKEESYEHDVIAGLRTLLLKGTYDPRGLGEAGKAAAKKLGQFVAKYLFKYFVLMPLAPFLVLPWDIYGLVDKVIGSDHPTVWLVCLQLCLQRMLLAAHDININEYYMNLVEEMPPKNI